MWVRNVKGSAKVIAKDARAVRSECATQEPRRALRSRDSFLRFRFCAFVARGSSENRPKSFRKSMKIHPKSTQNRRKIDLGPSWAPKAVSGMRADSLGTAFGRPHAAPNPILGLLGRVKSGQEQPNSGLRASRRRSKSFWGDSQDAC